MLHTSISTEHLINYALHLADTSLIMGHRLSEWTGHGPMLEQDIALTNIALDLIGQSRYFYQYAALLKNSVCSPSGDEGATEDTLAYHRDAHEFKNIILAELPNGDWANTILKLFFFSTWQYLLYQKLTDSTDKQLAAIAEKSFKEVTYHVRWSSEWVIRLGDGTEESHRRLQAALDYLWAYTKELFILTVFEKECTQNGTGMDITRIKNDWDKKICEVFSEGMLSCCFQEVTEKALAGKEGLHTENLRHILSEMQFLQRTHPGCEW